MKQKYTPSSAPHPPPQNDLKKKKSGRGENEYLIFPLAPGSQHAWRKTPLPHLPGDEDWAVEPIAETYLTES